MSTHVTQCVVCHQAVFCCEDTHALGIGGKEGKGGCENPPYIEFCSVECCLELQKRLNENIAKCREQFPEMFREWRNPLQKESV